MAVEPSAKHSGMATRPLNRSRRSAGWPSEPTDIDNEVVALGGTTHAIDLTEATIQSQKVPVSREKRLEELLRVSSSLRQEVGYWKGAAQSVFIFIDNFEETVAQLHDIGSKLRSLIDAVTSVAEEKMEQGGAIRPWILLVDDGVIQTCTPY
ncbi:hypothetical protein LY78DRAFT_709348 [Colletotrichum sublineola]|nr:hypothetical protein LY78DRAFT_709348 [Colletotrichum sublineola]